MATTPDTMQVRVHAVQKLRSALVISNEEKVIDFVHKCVNTNKDDNLNIKVPDSHTSRDPT